MELQSRMKGIEIIRRESPDNPHFRCNCIVGFVSTFVSTFVYFWCCQEIRKALQPYPSGLSSAADEQQKEAQEQQSVAEEEGKKEEEEEEEGEGRVTQRRRTLCSIKTPSRL